QLVTRPRAIGLDAARGGRYRFERPGVSPPTPAAGAKALTSNGLKLTVQPPDGPARQGFPAALEVRVDNEGAEPLLLERAWGDGPLDGELVWRRPPSGVIAYDAAQDCYRWRTGYTTTALVPLCSGLLPPGGGCEGF